MREFCRMRTTKEFPRELLTQAKSPAAVQQKPALESRKVRREPPALGSKKSRPLRDLTSKQIDDAVFG
jgi:hypothetical protein